MAREDYQDQLEELQDDVLYMSELVLERLRMGLDALESKDLDTAEAVIEGDHEINQLYLELEQDCIDLLALQQPVAGDLRFIASSFKIITDLERIGDLATNLAGYAENAAQDRYPEVDVQTIGDRVIEMVEDAMAAYAEEDVDACREIADRDDEIDALCEDASQTVVRDLIEREVDASAEAAAGEDRTDPATGADETDPATGADGTEPAEVEALLQDVSRLLLTIRDLERVGDHAVNISARTLYMVESDDELIY